MRGAPRQGETADAQEVPLHTAGVPIALCKVRAAACFKNQVFHTFVSWDGHSNCRAPQGTPLTRVTPVLTDAAISRMLARPYPLPLSHMLACMQISHPCQVYRRAYALRGPLRPAFTRRSGVGVRASMAAASTLHALALTSLGAAGTALGGVLVCLQPTMDFKRLGMLQVTGSMVFKFKDHVQA
jgi:hypothetical protein